MATLYTSEIFDRQLTILSLFCSQDVLYDFALDICSLCLFNDDLWQYDSPCLSNGFSSIKMHENPDIFCMYKLDRQQKRVYLPFIGLQENICSIDYDNITYHPNDGIFRNGA